ncbi:MAG TPA: PAS domain S-box protein [Rhodoferax sp.]|nr:PAS domain S-box protein [Rhodoferax sp.]
MPTQNHPEVLLQLLSVAPHTVSSVAGDVESMLGYSASKLLQGEVSILALIHPDDQDVLDAMLHIQPQSAAQPQTHVCNLRLRQASGRIRCLVAQYAHELAATGVVLNLRLRDAKSLFDPVNALAADPGFRSMMESTNDFIFFKDRHHVFTAASQTLVSVTQPSTHWTDLIGQTDYDVFPEEYADIYYRLEKQVFAGKTVAHEVQEYQTSDGVKGWVDNRKYPIRTAQGEITGLFGIARVMTEQVRAEQALRLERDSTRNILATVEAMIVALDTGGRITLVNRKGCQILGYREAELIGQDWFATCLPRTIDVEQVRDIFKMSLAGNLAGAEYFENPVLTRSGEERLIAWHNSTIRDKDGHTIGGLSAGEDITERKQKEHELQQREQYQRALLDNFPFAVWLKDTESRFLTVNQGFVQLFGQRSAIELVGKTDFDIAPTELAKGYQADDRAVLGTGKKKNVEEEIVDADGVRKWFETYKAPVFNDIGSVVGSVGFARDITERRAAAQAMAELSKALAVSRDLLQKVIDTAPIRVFWKDRDCRYLGCNPAFARDAGKSAPADLIGLDDYAMCWVEQADLYRADDRQVMESGQPRLDFEEPQTSPDGKPLWLRTSKVPLRDAAGVVIGVLGLYDDITERRQAEIALRHEKQFSEDSLNALPGVFYMFDTTGRFVRWNHQFNKVTGYTDAELASMRGTDFFVGEDQRLVAEAMQRVFAQGQAEVEADFQTRDGGKLPYHFIGHRSTIGDQIYLLGVGLDISEQRRTRQALEIQRTHLQTLVNTIPDLIWLKAGDGTYLACNPEFERFFGAAENDIVGKTDHDFVPKALADAFRKNDCAAIANGEATRNEEWITYASDGHRVLLETTKIPMRTPDGRLVGVLGIGHDITEREAHQKQLEHIAHFDTLTSLPNRVLLADRLQQALAQAQRHGKVLAVAYIDLDGFKAINDKFGHDVGDRMLTALAGHMKKSLREGDTLARLGGDEFVAILLDLSDVESSAPLLSRLIAAAAEVVYEDGNALRVSASLGVTFYPQVEAIDSDQLLRQADQAMYQAKQAGKNRYHVFDTEHDRTVRGHHESLERIRQALDEREFVLYYQPKVNLRTGVVIGAEALIRWQHPQQGLLPPASFLPLIADHPLAIEMGEWVLATAMTQVEDWKRVGIALPVSVNIDAIHLEQADFVDRLRQQLSRHPGVVAGDLELEVLETSALQDIAHVSGVILACNEMGVGFALDDFGTGYSSLTYLKRLPAGVLKIDQSFVRDMLEDPDDLAILDGVLGLASAFRRQAIAEGVETLAHAEVLLQLGCPLVQGYAIARPMPASSMPSWLATWRPDAAWFSRAPIRREDMPILYAWVEHRAWIAHVLGYLQGERSDAPPLDCKACRVGQWLGHARGHHANHSAAIAAVEPLHVEIHARATEMIRFKQLGQTDVLPTQMEGFYRLRDRLLAQLFEMLR